MDNQRSGHYVAKLAQRFFDARTADDKDLVFSSEFPLLKEEATGVLVASQLGTSNSYQTFFSHKLNYHPFFLIYNSNGELLQSTSWAVDDRRLYVLNPPSNPLTQRYRWVIYRLPLYDSFFSGVSDGVSLPTSEPTNYVLKLAKKGKSIHSTDLRDFTIHSRARSPLVHIVSPHYWKDGDTEHIVEHGFSYNPIVFGYGKTVALDGKTTFISTGGQSQPFLDRRPGTLQILSSTSATTETSLVVFKDPFTAPIVKDVRY